MNMINDVVNIVEPMQAVLPTWLLASIIINGGKLISEVFSDDVDDEDSKSQGDDISYKGCFSSYLSDQSWPKQCQEINNLYKATPSAYSEDINFNHITSLWGRYAGTSSCVAYPKIPQDFRVDIMRNFKISESEEVIFIYDLSWGKRQKGICLTNNSIYIVTNYDDPNQRVVIDWASLSQVCYDEGNFYFIGYNENYVAIPNNFFNATFVDCQQIADFFSKIASSTLPVEKVKYNTCKSVTYSESEQEYLDELKACMKDDGEVSISERRLLSSLQHILGISDNRAQELEDICKETNDVDIEGQSENHYLNHNEQEYVNEYLLCLDNGDDITITERRLLNRLRDRLNITIERSVELEYEAKAALSQISDDNKDRLLSVMNIVESVRESKIR